MNRFESTLRGIMLLTLVGVIVMCVPPADTGAEEQADTAKLDSLRNVRCPRLMSSAAEYYRNQDWPATVRVYRELVDLGCDESHPQFSPPEEIYLYWAIAYEYLAKYDSSEYVLLRGLQKLPDNIDLRKRLAYAYKKLGKFDKEIVEYERLMDMAPEDASILTELADLYGQNERYDDQIYVLRKLLELEPDNEIAQGELAIAYENSGKDPLEFIRERFEKNPDNISYGLDYADRLLNADRPEEALTVLEKIITIDNTSRLAYRKLAETYNQVNDLENASKAYEELFKLDPRDSRVAIQISDLNIELKDFDKAYRWAEKAVQISKSSGAALAQKGKVYYKAFQECRGDGITDDDRIVASLAHTYFTQAEEKNFSRYLSSRKWLEDNEVLFTKANWFMLDPKVKRKGYLTPTADCYQWVTEKLDKDPNW